MDDDNEGTRRLRVVPADSREAGSCCFCDRSSTSHGQASHRVHEASGAGIKVRFCDYCAREFAAATATARGRR